MKAVIGTDLARATALLRQGGLVAIPTAAWAAERSPSSRYAMA